MIKFELSKCLHCGVLLTPTEKELCTYCKQQESKQANTKEKGKTG